MNLKNPLPWPLAGMIAIAVLGVTGCGGTVGVHRSAAAGSSTAAPTPAAEPGVTTYLCQFSNEDLLLQWNASDEYLSGTYQDATISGTAPQEQVNTNRG